MSWLTHTSPIYSVLLALFFALAAGLVGSFALLRRMLLAGDVISHLALPGLGLALLLKVNPLMGAATTLFLGTILIWHLQNKSGLATENIIGVVFAGSLGVGAAVTPNEDLMEALFGNFQQLSRFSFVIGVAAAIFVVVCLWRLKNQLVLSLFSGDLAVATGVNLSRINLYFLLLFSLTILIGLRFMGALLAASLIIIPAAIGRRLTDNISHFSIASSVASVLSVGIGVLLNASVFPKFGLGPTTVIVAALLFAACLFKKAA